MTGEHPNAERLLATDQETTLEDLCAYWGTRRASDVGQETLNRLEELQRARAQIEELCEQIKTMHKEHREERNQLIRDAREDMAEAASNARLDALEESDHGCY